MTLSPEKLKEKIKNDPLWVERHGAFWPPLKDEKGIPRARMPDWKIEAECVKQSEEKHCKEWKGKAWHFKRMITILMTKPNGVVSFQWNPNAERIVEAYFNEKFVAVAGHGSCVHGDTRMLNPIDGSTPTIKELCESKTRPIVQTLNGPILADIPYLKGRRHIVF
jgi:hypothetical protein